MSEQLLKFHPPPKKKTTCCSIKKYKKCMSCLLDFGRYKRVVGGVWMNPLRKENL